VGDQGQQLALDHQLVPRPASGRLGADVRHEASHGPARLRGQLRGVGEGSPVIQEQAQVARVQAVVLAGAKQLRGEVQHGFVQRVLRVVGHPVALAVVDDDHVAPGHPEDLVLDLVDPAAAPHVGQLHEVVPVEGAHVVGRPFRVQELEGEAPAGDRRLALDRGVHVLSSCRQRSRGATVTPLAKG
jgi:hypothetical protein